MLALSQLTPFLFPKIHAEEISGNNGYVELSFCAKKLDDKVRNDVVLFFIKKRYKIFFSGMNYSAEFAFSVF